MKNCTNCKHARWQLTSAGKLHPSGDGVCFYLYVLPPLPQSMRWPGDKPTPNDRPINRRVDLADHCVYFARG